MCCMVGDARFLTRILQSFSIRLRTAKNHHSPAGELQRLQVQLAHKHRQRERDIQRLQEGDAERIQRETETETKRER